MSISNKYDSIGFLTNRASRAIIQLFNKKLQESNYQYRTDHIFLLYKIQENDSVSQQQLAEITCTDKATVTRHLDFLEKNELIERKNDKSDRRNKLIVLTNFGKNLLNEIEIGIKKDIIQQLSLGFTNSEEKELKRLLNKLYENIK